MNSDFFVSTELSLAGYPPQDLLFRKDFISKINSFKKKIINLTKKTSTIFVLNIPEIEKKKLFNTVFLIKSGNVIFKISKSSLPNYGVFDEKRYFYSGKNNGNLFKYKNKNLKFFICEDLWASDLTKKEKKKTDLIFVLNASPFEINKFKKRINISKKNAIHFNSPLIYLNLVGAQDDIVFDGGSFFMNQSGEIIDCASFFEEDEMLIDTKKKKKKKIISLDKNEHLYNALMISLNDYFKKNNFSTALIGISGGIDSALTASIAADVLGSSNIKSFFLPSIYTSKESRTDAKDLCENLNISLEEISIESSRKLILGELSFLFKNLKKDITEENVQSRIRGLLLMALSNKFNSLLLTTGNKSELLVGYSTLYGDMCGGFSLLKDLYKTEINELCKWRNKNTSNRFKINKKDIIPSNILLKEPTAELKFNQKDSDTLPSYDILDKILYLLIDKNKDLKTIMNKGFKEKIVRKIWKMVKNSEFKRYQSALGPKVSEMSLDRDRRFPITNKFIL